MGAIRIAYSTRMYPTGPKHTNDRRSGAVPADLLPDCRACTQGEGREHDDAHEVAGEVDEYRGNPQLLDGPAIVQRVARYECSGQQPVEHPRPRRAMRLPDQPGDEQNAGDHAGQPERREPGQPLAQEQHCPGERQERAGPSRQRVHQGRIGSPVARLQHERPR
jgi:hypothetical protein